MGKKWDGGEFNCSVTASVRRAGLRVSENAALPGLKHATTSEATRNNDKMCSTSLSECFADGGVKWINWSQLTDRQQLTNFEEKCLKMQVRR